MTTLQVGNIQHPTIEDDAQWINAYLVGKQEERLTKKVREIPLLTTPQLLSLIIDCLSLLETREDFDTSASDMEMDAITYYISSLLEQHSKDES